MSDGGDMVCEEKDKEVVQAKCSKLISNVDYREQSLWASKNLFGSCFGTGVRPKKIYGLPWTLRYNNQNREISFQELHCREPSPAKTLEDMMTVSARCDDNFGRCWR